YPDAVFYAGQCSYYLHEYDIADKRFSYYLALPGQTRHFSKTFEYKYLIAEAYRKGARRHLLGKKRLPKIVLGREASIALYDEVIVAMAGQEVAAKALYGKAKVLRKKRDFKESIECLKTLTRRFPKTPLAREAYLLISKVYLQQGNLEAQNPDYLQLAQVNLEKMKVSFPTDEMLLDVEKNYLQMQEIHATSLYDTGRYYERKKKLHAATIYYIDAIKKYPETACALDCQTRLDAISDYFTKNAYSKN
ncbi:MAG: tetratricopeptide repeat protein, partial [Chlamydiia bacterium]|nr:tetratricopeptide repeat protein [Chlamydiia bacterium]